MIEDKNSLRLGAAKLLGLEAGRLIFEPLKVIGSMSGKIEDGFDGSLFCLRDSVTDTSYVVKMKSASFTENVGAAMAPEGYPGFEEAFKRGWGVFYIRDSYKREMGVYSGLEPGLKRYIPKYYGSVLSGDTAAHVMEKLEIVQCPVNIDAAARFIAKLHAKYLNDLASAKRLGANIPVLSDYENAREMSHMLLEGAAKIYPSFTADIVRVMHGFACDAENNYRLLNDFDRTLCQGDYCVKNMSFIRGGAVIYDWELATYNSPQFDLASFLVHYPDRIDESIINGFLNTYKRESECLGNTQGAMFEDGLRFNIMLYMATRFHAMMNISAKVDMPYMPTSVGNWLYLFKYFRLGSGL